MIKFSELDSNNELSLCVYVQTLVPAIQESLSVTVNAVFPMPGAVMAKWNVLGMVMILAPMRTTVTSSTFSLTWTITPPQPSPVRSQPVHPRILTGRRTVHIWESLSYLLYPMEDPVEDICRHFMALLFPRCWPDAHWSVFGQSTHRTLVHLN